MFALNYHHNIHNRSFSILQPRTPPLLTILQEFEPERQGNIIYSYQFARTKQAF